MQLDLRKGCNDIISGVNFIIVKRANFLYECHFSSYVLALLKKFVQKICTYNVDEIDTWSHFHKLFTCAFFVQKQIVQLLSNYSSAL